MNIDPEFVRLIENAHAGQEYKGGVPYKHHLHRVAHLVTYFLQAHNEHHDPIDIWKAALAHDALEDTRVTKEDLKQFCNDKTIQWVDSLTRKGGDDKPSLRTYMNQMMLADEEAQLIKLADIFDNLTTGSRRIKENNVAWTRDYLLRVIADMCYAMRAVQFKRYPQTGKTLQTLCMYALDTLQHEIERWERDEPRQEPVLK